MGREDIANILRDLAQHGVSVLISSHILHDLETLCAEFILLRWGRIPRSLNEAASPDARTRWPEATTFRCEAPEKLARFLFARDLLRGCDIVPGTNTLHARWREPEKFFNAYHELLLESGVRIFEVQDTESFLEKAIDHTAQT
jgi:ABC-2 type transport system ATP-binding protein